MTEPGDSGSRLRSLWDPAGIAALIRVALPLMISTGTFSLVLFIDRTLLLNFDGAAMSASMAAGNLFWALICLPVGIASMTGAFVGQYIGAGVPERVGRMLWQAIWMALGGVPFFAALAWAAPWLFQLAGQPESLVHLESIYLRILLLGAVGSVIDTALSGFFSGRGQTQVVMWVSIAASVLNVGLDLWFIFGAGPLPPLGIVGAGIASAICFWLKAFLFAGLIWFHRDQAAYGIRAGFGWEPKLLGRFLFYGFPAGLQFLVEAGGFTVIVLQIGALGDLPLRATTMAINFNMVAYIPLVGLAIATSVLVGRNLKEFGPDAAARVVRNAWVVAMVYSAAWAVVYLVFPDGLLSLYRVGRVEAASLEAVELARGLLWFVALYVLFDATQLMLASSLRGAGDTWFVLLGTLGCSALVIGLGVWAEPQDAEAGLRWWWTMITLWVWMLSIAMALRYFQGRWRSLDMAGTEEVIEGLEGAASRASALS